MRPKQMMMVIQKYVDERCWFGRRRLFDVVQICLLSVLRDSMGVGNKEQLLEPKNRLTTYWGGCNQEMTLCDLGE